jgi:hypothetical protein
MADETSGDMRGGGGLAPGGYYFYAYTGELRGGRFVADEKSLLGRFVCSVEDDKERWMSEPNPARTGSARRPGERWRRVGRRST